MPPTVTTTEAIWDAASKTCLLHGNLADLGAHEKVEVGFQYRRRKLLTEANDEWQESAFEQLQSAGEYSRRIGNLENETNYECRAVARHRSAAVCGDSLRFQTD